MNRTIRQFGAPTIALTVLSAWLVSTSACGGGGGGSDAPDESADVTSAPADGVDSGSPGESASPSEATPPPSSFEPGVPGDPPDTETGEDTGGTDTVPTATDDGPALQRPTGEGSDTSAIAGFWDYSRATANGPDVVRFVIDENGGLTEYDDQADAAGTGADCHVVSRGSIASRGSDRYDIQDSSTLPGSRSVDDVLITVDGPEIVFRYLGTGADPQSGGSLTGITERYPAVTDRTVDDLTVCES